MTVHDSPTVPTRARLTVADFRLLDGSGTFARYARTELIDGEILVVNAQYARHARMARAMFVAVDRACRDDGSGLEALFELSVLLDDGNLPQPDLVVARSVPADGPLPAGDVVLAIEIADTSATYDLGDKARLYAFAGIPEYWVVEVGTGLVHQLWNHADGTYREHHRQPLGTVLASATSDLTVTLPAA